MKQRYFITSWLGIVFAGTCAAQVLNSNPGGGGSNGGGSGPGNSGGGKSGGGSGGQVVGRDVPTFDPGSGNVAWDGNTWNVADQPLFEARFEKYLAAPAAVSTEDQKYREILDEVLDALSPHRTSSPTSGPSLTRAVALLPAAAQYPIDARLSDTIANAVYGVWLGQKNSSKLNATISEMAKARRDLAWNSEVDSTETAFEKNDGGSEKGKGRGAAAAAAADVTRGTLYVKDILELEAKSKLMQGEVAVSDLRSKIEFQSLILQLFIQRRFEHTIIACRLYRQLFRDGDSALQIEEGSDVSKMFSSGLGVNPTINTLDSFANEAIRDVDEGIDAFHLLLEKGELDSASRRLAETFMVGEYLPKVRRVSLDDKRAVVAFVRDGHQLRKALEYRDIGTAEEILNRMKGTATDFDSSQAVAAIGAAKTSSEMILNQAKLAALQGDGPAVEEKLKQAMEIWPANPKISEVQEMIFKSGDIKSQTLMDLDRLVAQKNYRQVFNDQGRYAGAVLDDPARQEVLKQIITDMTRINMEIQGARNMSRDGYHHAAWESITSAAEEFPDDSEVTKLKADLTTKVAEFVQALDKAEGLEERGQLGSSAVWYLKARRLHPQSNQAKSGIDRVVSGLRPTGSSVDVPPSSDPLESEVERSSL